MPRSSNFIATATTATLLTLSSLQVIQQVAAQADDVIWHNRYHALLAMGVYGDWQTLCPSQTFTQEGLLKNFPDSTAEPWTVLDTWGPTEHGSEGFTAYIPEMDKVTLVFKGDYNLEKNLPIESADITEALDLGDACVNCKANAFALAGYLEAVQATNGFENAVAKWKDVGCYFSVTGHGLGGAHSLLATLHYNKMIEFSHNFGTPRVLNPAAANYYDYLLGGYQIDRGAANADIFMSMVPQSDDWAFTNTGIWYHGYNETYKMNMESCIEQPEDAACLPQGDLNELDHVLHEQCRTMWRIATTGYERR
ncbi:hypothetical protein P389DRAFT_20272 [Cystobasidium minutum MCA 4210]|uniref:uncharacterized protein n=1 Tax=Cystobasidium minutum MCA 4210 TaxID=1397322 RepID=UPI0034CEE5BF|eukprot:jgi/Rhomi1/20272/CE20271_1103